MKKFLFSITLIFPTLLFSQIFNPVQWEFSKEDLGNSEYDLFFTATIDDGWYLYSQYVEEDGPLPTSFTFYESDKYELIGKTNDVGPNSFFHISESASVDTILLYSFNTTSLVPLIS